jgi:hypothetical protein
LQSVQLGPSFVIYSLHEKPEYEKLDDERADVEAAVFHDIKSGNECCPHPAGPPTASNDIAGRAF